MWQLKDGLFFDDEFPFLNMVTSVNHGNLRDEEVLKKFCLDNKIDYVSLVRVQQVHGGKVVTVTGKARGTVILDADGMVTYESDLPIAVFTADCMPVFFASKEKQVAALVHAGWKSLFKGIIPKTINILWDELDVKPSELNVSIGPHIHKCCYKVGYEVSHIFGIQGNENFIELSEIAIKQMKKLGVNKVSVCPHCTCHENDLFFSHRKESTSSRMMSLLQIK